MKINKLHTILLFVCAAQLAYAAEQTYDNPLYWIAQEAGTLLDYKVFSPTGSATNPLTSNPTKEQWASYDIVFDARYSGSGTGAGINNITGLAGDLYSKSVTIAANWDKSLGSNKERFWWTAARDKGQENLTWTVTDDFNFFSGMGGDYHGITMNIGGDINIDVSAFQDGSTTVERPNRNVDFKYFKELNVNNINIVQGNYTNFEKSEKITIHGSVNANNTGTTNFNNLEVLTIGKGFSITNGTGNLYMNNNNYMTINGGFVAKNLNDVQIIGTKNTTINGDMTIHNANYVRFDTNKDANNSKVYDLSRQTNTIINGNLNITSDQINDKREWNFIAAGINSSNNRGLYIRDNVNVSNINKILGYWSNNFHVGGDFNINDVNVVAIDKIGVKFAVNEKGDGFEYIGYTNPETNGFRVDGSMILKRVGNPSIAEYPITFWDSAFVKIGKNLEFYDLGANASFTSIGNYNGVGGGVEIGQNLIFDNSNTDKRTLDFVDSNYLKVGGNVNLKNCHFTAYRTHDIDVAGDFTADANSTIRIDYAKVNIGGNLTVGIDIEARNGGYVYVGKDLIIGAAGDAKLGNFFGKDGALSSEDNVGTFINGQVKMTEGSKFGQYFYDPNETAPTVSDSIYTRVGGFDGQGTIYLSKSMLADKTKGGLSSTIIIDAQKDSKFIGTISQANNEGAFDSMSLNIIKNGLGSQKFALLSAQWNGSVTVNKGMFELFLTGSNKVDIILNESSKLGVAFSYDGEYDPDITMGEINANDIFVNGKSSIAFDVSQFDNGDGTFYYENDIIFANNISGDGELDLILDLSLIDESTEVSLTGLDALNIFRVSTNNAYDWDGKAKVIVMYKGADISESFTIKNVRNDSNGIYVELNGVVPEPAEMATVFGILILMFVAWRRIK